MAKTVFILKMGFVDSPMATRRQDCVAAWWCDAMDMFCLLLDLCVSGIHRSEMDFPLNAGIAVRW